MTDIRGSISADVDTHLLHKEWDEVSCPICMDHPHNAVLLLCSSHEKGCRTYICDTSYRHSNCLDRFKKLKVNHKENPEHGAHFHANFENERPGYRSLQSLTPEPVSDGQRRRINLTRIHEASDFEAEANAVNISQTRQETQGHERIDLQQSDGGDIMSEQEGILKCPLCRGSVLGYRIVKEARQYLDLKPRTCSWETCAFYGNYRALRRHARQIHPTKRPSDVDPSRLRAWFHLENDREIGDVLSALQSTSPNAIVIGDYIIDGSNGSPHNWENGNSGGASRWRTTFDLELNQLIRDPLGPVNLRRSLSRSWRTNRRSGQRYLWGANLLGLQDEEDRNGFPDGDVVSMQQRTLRRSRHQSPWGENILTLQHYDDDDDDDNDEPLDVGEVPRRHRRFVRPRHDADSHNR